jgi:hypothetical protein
MQPSVKRLGVPSMGLFFNTRNSGMIAVCPIRFA